MTRDIEQQGMAAARAYPGDLAETLFAVHRLASQHYGRMLARYEFARLNGGRHVSSPPRYERARKLLRTMIGEAVNGMRPVAAALFLVHEACRALQRFNATHDPALFDVQEILLEEAERLDGSLPTEAVQPWFESREGEPPCALIRDAVGDEWPSGFYDAQSSLALSASSTTPAEAMSA